MCCSDSRLRAQSCHADRTRFPRLLTIYLVIFYFCDAVSVSFPVAVIGGKMVHSLSQFKVGKSRLLEPEAAGRIPAAVRSEQYMHVCVPFSFFCPFTHLSIPTQGKGATCSQCSQDNPLQARFLGDARPWVLNLWVSRPL